MAGASSGLGRAIAEGCAEAADRSLEGDVEAAEVRRHSFGVGLDGILIERVDDRGLRRAAGRATLRGHGFERLNCPPSQMDAGALACERLRDRRPA